MASPKTQWQMAAHHRLPQVESASTIVTMAYDPVGPRNTKNQRLDDPVHIGSPSGFGRSLSTPTTNISWHSLSATDSTPSHGVPLAMPTHRQNLTFSLTRHALTPESEATLST